MDASSTRSLVSLPAEADLAGSAWLCSGILYGSNFKRRTRFSEFSISFENTGWGIISLRIRWVNNIKIG